MFFIEFETRDRHINNAVVGRSTNNQDLFNLVIILDKSDNVVEFKVSIGAMTVTHPSEFGWGDIEKWVMCFSWETEARKSLLNIYK